MSMMSVLDNDTKTFLENEKHKIILEPYVRFFVDGFKITLSKLFINRLFNNVSMDRLESYMYNFFFRQTAELNMRDSAKTCMYYAQVPTVTCSYFLWK